MAVITKFFVVRNGVEIDKVFEDKKQAEAFDKMLDAAEKLTELIRNAELPAEIDEKTIEEISICLAKNAPAVTQILKGVKPLTPEKTSGEKKAGPTREQPAPSEPVAKKRPGQKPARKSKSDK